MSGGQSEAAADRIMALVEDSQAVFFDFDGVLADSVSVKTRAFGDLFAEYGNEIRQKVVEHHLSHGGMSRFDKFRHYYREFLGQPLNEVGMADLCVRFAELVVDKVVSSPEIPGAGAFLARIARGRSLFVVSATPEPEIREIVRRRGMDALFSEVCGSPVTKTEHVARLLGEHALLPERCLFFGDAVSDHDAALANTVPFVGVVPESGSTLLERYPGVLRIPDFTLLQI